MLLKRLRKPPEKLQEYRLMMKTAFIGLGNIGFPMARNLVESEFECMVYDVLEQPIQALVKKGALAAASVLDIAKFSSVIGVCVRDDNDVDGLLYGDKGLLAHCAKGTIIAIHSTVTQEGMIRWAKDGDANGLHIVDAPITGGAQGAADKTLCYMVGGSQEVLADLTPVLNTSAKAIVHAGKVGDGIVLKLCNNLVNYAAFTAIDEATRLADKAGIDHELVYQVGEVNGIVTEMMKRFVTGRDALKPACSDEDFKGVFSPFAKLAEKDLDAALACAKNFKTELPTTVTVRNGIEAVFFKEHN